MILLFFIMRCTPIIRELIVATRYRCPPPSATGLSALAPAERLERSDLCFGTKQTCCSPRRMSVVGGQSGLRGDINTPISPVQNPEVADTAPSNSVKSTSSRVCACSTRMRKVLTGAKSHE